VTVVLAFNAGTILFPVNGPRLSTDVMLAAFLVLAAWRHDPRPAIAGIAWIVGFENLFEATRRPHAWHWTLYVAVDVVGIAILARKGIRPSPLLLAATLAAWGAWLATGFHVNEHTMVHFQPGAEAFNEGAKTLWAAAYLVPFLLAQPKSRAPSASPQGSRATLEPVPPGPPTPHPPGLATPSRLSG
jgi:hypothetical protein